MLYDVLQPSFAPSFSSRTPAESMKGEGGSLHQMSQREIERGRTTTSSGSIFLAEMTDMREGFVLAHSS